VTPDNPALLGLLWYAVFVVSTTFHEAAHALAAYRGGDPTAYRTGQVSLSPIPHIRREPFGMVLVPLLTALTQGWCIGWASTPYDPRWEARYPRRAAWMAAAGPAANFLLALIALTLLRVGLALGIFYAPESVGFGQLIAGSTVAWGIAGRLLSILLVLNVILGLFNLIPAPPLDGATAITLFLPEDASLRFRYALRTGGAGLIGLLAAWWLFGQIVRPVFAGILWLVHPDVPYG
jgi:Zn-dependent protease